MNLFDKGRTVRRVRRPIAVWILLGLYPLTPDLSSQNRNPVNIDPALTFAHIQKLVSFGPRPPGSPGIAQAQSYITDCLKKLNLAVEHDDFLANTPNGS